MSQKESILEAIQRLPEDCAFDDAISEIHILKRIEEGVRAGEEGRVRTNSEVRALIRAWAEA